MNPQMARLIARLEEIRVENGWETIRYDAGLPLMDVLENWPDVFACRCCGKELQGWERYDAIRDGYAIHLGCILRHDGHVEWQRRKEEHYEQYISANRCLEFQANPPDGVVAE
jgi:hypothetical protein